MTRWVVPSIVFGTFLAYLVASAVHPPLRSREGFNLTELGRLPVAMNGRVQPIDSVARMGLLQIRGTTTVPLDDMRPWQVRTRTLGATEWLLEVLTKPDTADTRRIFPVTDATLVAKLQLKTAGSGTMYSAFTELEPKVEEIVRQAQRIGKLKPADRAGWEREVLKLRSTLVIYERLKNSLQPNSFLQHEANGKPIVYDFAALLSQYRVDLRAGVKTAIAREHGSQEQLEKSTEDRMRTFAQPFKGVARAGSLAVIPPANPSRSNDHWHNIGAILVDSARSGQLALPVAYFAAISSASSQGKADIFNQEVTKYREWLTANGLAPEVSKARYEFFYNVLQPFVRAVAVYVAGLLMLCASWWKRSAALYRSAVLLIGLAAVLHTVGLAFDMMLSGHPPVTNRYSLIIFAGWGIAWLAFVAAQVRRNSMGMAAAALSGVIALIVAHSLAPGGLLALMHAVFDLTFLAAALVAALIVWRTGSDARTGRVVLDRPGKHAAHAFASESV
jgi:hypothetical protein